VTTQVSRASTLTTNKTTKYTSS